MTVSLVDPAASDLPISVADTATPTASATSRTVRSTPDSPPVPALAPVIDLAAARRKKFASVIGALVHTGRNRRSVLDTALSVALREALDELARLGTDEQVAQEWLTDIHAERTRLTRYATWLCHRLGTHTPNGCLRCTNPA